MAEYRCVGGHDLCNTMLPSKDCPYCEKVTKSITRTEDDQFHFRASLEVSASEIFGEQLTPDAAVFAQYLIGKTIASFLRLLPDYRFLDNDPRFPGGLHSLANAIERLSKWPEASVGHIPHE